MSELLFQEERETIIIIGTGGLKRGEFSEWTIFEYGFRPRGEEC